MKETKETIFIEYCPFILNEQIKCYGANGNFDCKFCKIVPDLQAIKIKNNYDGDNPICEQNYEKKLRQIIANHRKANENPYLVTIDDIYTDTERLRKKNKDIPKWILECIGTYDNPQPRKPIFLDHTRIYKKDGDWCVTGEPYGLTMEHLESLIEYCKEKCITFEVDGVSSHNPAHTPRIYFYEKSKNKAFLFLSNNWG